MSRIREKAFWIAAGDFGGRGLAFLTTIYLARTLGAEFYGMITIAVSVLGYATWGADLGLLNIGVRETAKEPDERIFRAREIFNLKVILGTIVLLISAIVISYSSISAIQRQIILGYLYSLIPYALLLDWYFSGKQHFGKLAFSKILNGAVYLGLVYWLVESSENVTLVPVLYTLGITFSVVVLGTFALIDNPFTLPSRGLSTYKKLIKSSSIIGLGGFFAQVVQLLPPIMIGIFLSLKEAGIYGAAFRVIVIAMMLDRIFVNLLLPNLSSLWSSNKESAIQKVNMVLKLVIVGGSLLSILVAINAEQIIFLLFGSDFSSGTEILQVLSVFIFLTFLNSLFTFGLIATNNDKKYFKATCLGGIVSAIIISVFAINGTYESVSFSVVIAELILTGTSYFWFRKIIPVKLFRSLTILVVLSGALFFGFQYFEIHYIIASVLSIILIPVLSWNTRVIKIGELNWLKEKLLK